ncbi:MAG: prolipoprotein diacylglyceryl transferase family protein [Patescibacteria group bacterium]|nr:prolipoprotein diacylglyceryl transferase family protein [Patescibacteria group bacterium]
MIDPVFLHLGPVTIYYQGILLALGVFLGAFLFWQRAREEGFDEEKILDLSLISLVAGIFGARLVFIAINFSVFKSNWSDVFRSLGSGLNFLGGFAFGAGSFYLFVRRKGWSVLKLADLAVPPLLLGQAFGSVGVLVSRLVVPHIWVEILAYIVLFVLALVVERQRFFNLFGSVRVGALTSFYLVGSGLVSLVFDFYSLYSGDSLFTFQKAASSVMVVCGLLLGYRVLSGKDKFGEEEKVSLEDISNQLRDWLRSEKDEIMKETTQLRQGDQFFREGREDDNAESGDEAEELLSHEYVEVMSDFLHRFGSQIDKALSRLQGGNYHECERCGKTIDPQRLRAYPAATMCKECAEKADKFIS